MYKQIKALIIKNLRLSFRNGELLYDISIPIFVAVMLALKGKNSINNIE